jgi:ABC-type sulfate transport system substrate-binding protein
VTPKYRVRYTEYERGWGSRPEGFTDFDTLEEAKEHARQYNAENTETVVPDWYMIAENPVFVDADVTKS